MDEPTYFTAGDTVEWEKSLSDYPASEWTLTYHFWTASYDFSVVATSDNDDYLATISAAVSADVPAGKYEWNAVVSAGEGATLERHTVACGVLQVLADPSAGTGTGIDTRSAVKIALDAIDAVLAETATREQASYSIAGRALELRKPEELIALRAHYARLYAREKRELRITQGLGGKRIYTRFN